MFSVTRQLPLAEWREYWAMEAINDRGVGIDVDDGRARRQLASRTEAGPSAELTRLTGGAVSSVDQVAKMTAWLLGRCRAEGARHPDQDARKRSTRDGEVIKPAEATS